MTREIGIFGSGDVLLVFPNGLNVNLCTGVGAYADDCESATIFQPKTHYDADCCKPWTRREVHYGSTCEVSVYRGDENVTAWFGPVVYAGGEPVLGHLTPVEAVDLLYRVSTWASLDDLKDDLLEMIGITDDDDATTPPDAGNR